MQTQTVAKREHVVSFIHRQMNHKSPMLEGKTHYHYGLCELREVLDFIYQESPTTKEEEL